MSNDTIEKKFVEISSWGKHSYFQFIQGGKVIATATPAFVSPTTGNAVGWILKIGEEKEGKEIETMKECERIIALL